jgi:hypothetical protein
MVLGKEQALTGANVYKMQAARMVSLPTWEGTLGKCASEHPGSSLEEANVFLHTCQFHIS